MNLKKFLKPTKWKIVIAIIILLLIYFIPIIPCYSGLTTGIQRYVGAWEMCSLGLHSLGNYYDYFGLKNSIIFSYLYLAIIAYLLSGLIIYLYSTKKRI